MTIAARVSLISIIAVACAAVLMRVPLFTIGPVQPNLILCVLIASSLFTTNGSFFAVLVAVTTIFARPSPAFFDPFTIGLVVAAFFIFFIKKYAVWPNRLGVIILAALSTITMYLIVSVRFIGTHPWLFFFELIANIVVSICIFEFFTLLIGRRHE